MKTIWNIKKLKKYDLKMVVSILECNFSFIIFLNSYLIINIHQI